MRIRSLAMGACLIAYIRDEVITFAMAILWSWSWPVFGALILADLHTWVFLPEHSHVCLVDNLTFAAKQSSCLCHTSARLGETVSSTGRGRSLNSISR